MTLLDFARGPAMQWSLIILVLGVVLRLSGALLLARTKGLSQGRGTNYRQAGLRTIFTRMLPTPGLEKRVRFSTYAGYVWHVGLLITVIFYAPHIEWFKAILGFGWPHLPNGVVILSAAVTLAPQRTSMPCFFNFLILLSKAISSSSGVTYKKS